jgi:hypothetical protein
MELNLAGSLILINGGSVPYYQGPSEIITGVWFKGVPDIYDIIHTFLTTLTERFKIHRQKRERNTCNR